jgi:hypothetical protein
MVRRLQEQGGKARQGRAATALGPKRINADVVWADWPKGELLYRIDCLDHCLQLHVISRKLRVSGQATIKHQSAPEALHQRRLGSHLVSVPLWHLAEANLLLLDCKRVPLAAGSTTSCAPWLLRLSVGSQRFCSRHQDRQCRSMWYADGLTTPSYTAVVS